jgi:putative flippase GtrA
MFAVTFSYVASTIFHYIANRKYTFSVEYGTHKVQISRYIIVCALNYFITILVVRATVTGYSMSPFSGVFISIIFTAITGYVLGNYWVFKNKKKDLCQQ